MNTFLQIFNDISAKIETFDFTEPISEPEVMETMTKPKKVPESESETEPETEPEPELDPEPREPIPNSTDQSGVVYLYYAAANKETFDELKQLDTTPEVDELVTKKSILKFLWSAIWNKNEMLIEQVKTCLPNYKLLSSLQNIEEMREQNKDLTFGDFEEYRDNEQLDKELIRFRRKNLPAELCRVLYKLEWTVQLNLPENWETISFDISDISTNKGTQALYTLAMQQYMNCVRQVISFREKYYTYMQRSVINNELDVQFWQDFGDARNELIEFQRRFYDFMTRLSWIQKKRYQKRAENPSAPVVNLNFQYTYRTLYQYDRVYGFNSLFS